MINTVVENNTLWFTSRSPLDFLFFTGPYYFIRKAVLMRLNKVIALNQKAILSIVKFQAEWIGIFFYRFFICRFSCLSTGISINYNQSYPSGVISPPAQNLVSSERVSIGHQFIPINCGC
jgi:hypothetical protein